MPTEPPTPTPGLDPSRALPRAGQRGADRPRPRARGERGRVRRVSRVAAVHRRRRHGRPGRRRRSPPRWRSTRSSSSSGSSSGPAPALAVPDGPARCRSAPTCWRSAFKVANQQHPRGRRRQPRAPAAWAPRRPRWPWARPRWWSAHVGDVRVYRLRGGALTPADPRPLGGRGDARRPAGDDRRPSWAPSPTATSSPGRWAPARRSRPTVTSHPLERGDLYLLCSDGLWSMVEPDRLAQLLGAGPDLDADRPQPDRRRQPGGRSGQHHRPAGAGLVSDREAIGPDADRPAGAAAHPGLGRAGGRGQDHRRRLAGRAGRAQRPPHPGGHHRSRPAPGRRAGRHPGRRSRGRCPPPPAGRWASPRASLSRGPHRPRAVVPPAGRGQGAAIPRCAGASSPTRSTGR